MTADFKLKNKQAFWETPRNLFIAAGALVAIVATVAALAGYKAGQQPAGITLPPGTIITVPAAPR